MLTNKKHLKHLLRINKNSYIVGFMADCMLITAYLRLKLKTCSYSSDPKFRIRSTIIYIFRSIRLANSVSFVRIYLN